MGYVLATRTSLPHSVRAGGTGPLAPVLYVQGVRASLARGTGTVAPWHRRCAEMSNFNQKTVAISFFVFFACIAPAITFGAMYSKFTHYWIGPVEMIAATAWCRTL